MKLILTFIGSMLIHGFLFSQNYQLKNKVRLSDTLSESSGLIHFNGKFFTHGDSGDEPVIYEIDTVSGCIKTIYHVPGAVNIDWEEITHDDSFIYIGDFGNNAGNRKNLVIYKLKIDDLLNLDTQARVGKIDFSYANQTDFTNKTYQTNFDAEAMIATDSGLFIFTKNWGNFKTYVYKCPKEIGVYSIQLVDSFNVGGLVTGSSYFKSLDQLILCGYTFNAPFVVLCDSFFWKGFFKTVKRQSFDGLGNIQVEAVAHLNSNRVFLTSEKLNQNATLHELIFQAKMNSRSNLLFDSLRFYINSNENKVIWDPEFKIVEAHLYHSNGQTLLTMKQETTFFNELNVMGLSDGVYIISVVDIQGKSAQFKFLLNR